MEGPRILPRAAGPARGTITAPPSKSITHRALVAAALCRGTTRVENPLDAEDTRLTASALEALGAGVERAGSVWLVRGFPGGVPGRPGESAAAGDVRLELGNSGTSLRLLLPVAALGAGAVVLDGSPRLRQRPVGPQAAALRTLGAHVEELGEPGCPPVRVRGPLAGGRATLDARASSQLLSGLLLAAPRAAAPVEIQVGGLSSRPYVDLTVAVLAAFGITVQVKESGQSDAAAGLICRVSPAEPVSPGTFVVEGDASAAAFLLAAAAVTGGEVTVRGVGEASAQGDRRMLALLAEMGCATAAGPDWLRAAGRPRRGLAADLNDVPDLVPPVVAVALHAPGPSRLTGIGHLRLKESDRLAALAGEAGRLGGRIAAGEDSLEVSPAPLHGGAVSACGDHRIAMAQAVAALPVAGDVFLDDTASVAKSWPAFFEDLAALLAFDGR